MRRQHAIYLTAGGLAALMSAGCPSSGPTPAKNPTPVEHSPQESSDPLRHPSEVHLADIIQLTNGGENAEAYWSFDGTRLIFQTTRPPFGCDQIMTMPADGSAEPTLVSTGKGRTTCAYYLPGDEHIVYASTHEASPECPQPPDHSKGYVWALYDTYNIYKARVDGSELVKLTDRKGYDAEATVCAKDGTIIFTSDRDGDLELYSMDAEGGNVKRLTSTPGYDGGAFFSQDCSQIVWRASRPQGADLDEYRALLGQGLIRPGKLEIFVADADGKNARQVTYLDAATFAPYFHPSQKRILFSSNYGDPRGREFDIWAVDVDGSNLEQITFSAGFDGFPMFSPDGTRLAFASNRNQDKPGETNVFVARWIESPPRDDKQGAVERFRDRVAWLADDERQGRGVGTAGLDASADWIAAEMKTMGVTAAGEGGYKQGFEVAVELVRKPETSLTINGKSVAEAAFTPASISASAQVSAQAVFAGYGIVARDLGVDDYKGINARGKVVVVRRFTPTKKPFDNEDARRRYSDIPYKAFEARQRGAVGLIVVDMPAKGEKETPDAPLPELSAKGKDAGIPIVVVTREAGASLVAARGRHTVTMSVAVEPKKQPVYNVIGKIPASAGDRLPGAVVVGAHYDHLGLGDDDSLAPDKKGIHNGADDNASGVAALLDVAGALMARRAELRRDVYVVAFTAEESGLLGSRYFVDNLPDGLKAEDIAAMVNMDMVGRLRDNQVAVLGVQSALEWGDVLQPACDAARIRCSGGGDGYGPSDQTSFYSAGVPVLHFFTGSHFDYHKPSDDWQLINAAGGARIAQVVSAVAKTVANRDARLSYQRVAMPPPRGDVRQRGGSLGTIPAYGDTGAEPGMILGDVRPGGPADKAGLRSGDRIIRIDSAEIRSVSDLMFVLREASPGQKARITVMREGKKLTVDAVYGEPQRRM
jgi:Tol biopolymer transport system component